MLDYLVQFFSMSGSGEVARKLSFIKSLLYLVVNEFDEGLVLFRKLLLQDLVVFLSNLVRPFLQTHKQN